MMRQKLMIAGPCLLQGSQIKCISGGEKEGSRDTAQVVFRRFADCVDRKMPSCLCFLDSTNLGIYTIIKNIIWEIVGSETGTKRECESVFHKV